MKKYDISPALETKIGAMNPPVVMTDTQQERFEYINEKLYQVARQMLTVAPDCQEKDEAMKKLTEFSLWLKLAVAKDSSK